MGFIAWRFTDIDIDNKLTGKIVLQLKHYLFIENE